MDELTPCAFEEPFDNRILFHKRGKQCLFSYCAWKSCDSSDHLCNAFLGHTAYKNKQTGVNVYASYADEGFVHHEMVFHICSVLAHGLNGKNCMFHYRKEYLSIPKKHNIFFRKGKLIYQFTVNTALSVHYWHSYTM